MKYTTINSLCEAVADAIRSKEGSTELINPQDFVKRIDNLQVGGGTTESSIEYLDVSGNMFLADMLASGIVEMKITIENSPFPIEGVIGVGTAVFSLVAELKQMGATANILAVSYNRDAIALTKQDGVVTTQTAYEHLAIRGDSYLEAYNSCPRITKEQFYSLE